MTSSEELVFVYNADTGLGNALLDTGRRILQPKDYPCALCMITYGPFGMKKDWKNFVSSLPYPVTFLHKDEASSVLPNITFSPPSLILAKDNLPIVLLQAKDFEKINNLEALKLKISTLLKQKRKVDTPPKNY